GHQRHAMAETADGSCLHMDMRTPAVAGGNDRPLFLELPGNRPAKLAGHEIGRLPQRLEQRYLARRGRFPEFFRCETKAVSLHHVRSPDAVVGSAPETDRLNMRATSGEYQGNDIAEETGDGAHAQNPDAGLPRD